MKIVNPSVEILHHGMERGTDYVLPEQLIEKVGRTCYKSEDKITTDSAAKFVSGLIKRGHEAMIEHYSLIFKVDEYTYAEILEDQDILMRTEPTSNTPPLRPFLRFTDCYIDGDEDRRYIVSGNMRAWRDYVKACRAEFGNLPIYLHGMIKCYPLFFPEYQPWVPTCIVNDIMIPISVSDLKTDFERSVHWDITVKFICDRGVSHEIVRHRTGSFAQESTRYCNYGLGKFGSEITVVMPAKWLDTDVDILADDPAYKAWYTSNVCSEMYYFAMLDAGSTPQESRAVLPNSLKTEIIVTGNLNFWDHFFDLRCAPDAHPDIQVVAKMARDKICNVIGPCI